MSGGKSRIFAFFQETHTDKEKVAFLRHEYSIGGHSHAPSGTMKSDEWHDGKGLHYKKGGYPDVHFTWEKVSKRLTGLIQKGRYLTEQEQVEHDKIQAEKALAEEDAMQAQQPDPAVWEYNGVKERHPDDMVLYQMGDFFEMYGEDAKEAAPELGLQLVSHAIPGGGHVDLDNHMKRKLQQKVTAVKTGKLLSPKIMLHIDDEKLICLAGKAKNGNRFKLLWAGNTTGYSSHSEADLARCNMLAFWFRRSGLYREGKWTARPGSPLMTA